MIEANLEAIVPGLAEERERERQNRGLAFVGITGAVCGVEVRPLTPFFRLALQMVRNRIVVGGAARRSDVVQYLMLLHPRHPGPERGRLRVKLIEWSIARRIRKMKTADAVREIQLHVAAQTQDLPDSDDGGRDFSNWVHWVAGEASFWLNEHGGFTLEGYMRTPYLVLQQLYRAWRLRNPKVIFNRDGSRTVVEPDFSNHSDRLVARWHRSRSEEIAALIRSRTTRLPD